MSESFCELVVTAGHEHDVGLVFLIGDEPRTMGRSSACDFVIADDQLSGMHCQVRREGDRWQVRDLLSRNGLHVNDELVDSALIEAGDELLIGTTKMRFSPSGDRGAPLSSSNGPPTSVKLDAGQVVDPLRQTASTPVKVKEPLGRLIDKRADLELAKLALKNDLLDHAQLRECIAIKREMGEVKIQMSLEEIFQEREYLTREQIEALMREYKFSRRRTKDVLYAEVAASNKLVPQDKLEAALAAQEQAYKAGDKIPYLGELLVREGAISIIDNNRVIKAIKQYREEDR